MKEFIFVLGVWWSLTRNKRMRCFYNTTSCVESELGLRILLSRYLHVFRVYTGTSIHKQYMPVHHCLVTR